MKLQYLSKVSCSLDSKLDSWSSKSLRIKFRGSSFENRVLRIENRGSSFEFRDTQRIFRGSRTEILRKRFNSWKQNNSEEQNNWHAALFAQTRFVCKYSFVLCIFYKAHAALELITPRQQTNVPAMCIYSFTCRSEWGFFLCVLQNPPDTQEF